MAVNRIKELVQEGLRRKLAGDLTGAAEAWSMALELDPKNERALSGLKALEAAGVSLPKAAPPPPNPTPQPLAPILTPLSLVVGPLQPGGALGAPPIPQADGRPPRGMRPPKLAHEVAFPWADSAPTATPAPATSSPRDNRTQVFGLAPPAPALEAPAAAQTVIFGAAPAVHDGGIERQTQVFGQLQPGAPRAGTQIFGSLGGGPVSQPGESGTQVFGAPAGGAPLRDGHTQVFGFQVPQGGATPPSDGPGAGETGLATPDLGAPIRDGQTQVFGFPVPTEAPAVPSEPETAGWLGSPDTGPGFPSPGQGGAPADPNQELAADPVRPPPEPEKPAWLDGPDGPDSSPDEPEPPLPAPVRDGRTMVAGPAPSAPPEPAFAPPPSPEPPPAPGADFAPTLRSMSALRASDPEPEPRAFAPPDRPGNAGEPAAPIAAMEEARTQPREEGPPDVGALLLQAIDKLDLDDHSGALELVERILAVEPDNATARELMGRCETTLTAMYESKLGDVGHRPRQLLKPDEIVWLNLDHRAGFLLSLVDGTYSYDDIFVLSSMSRLETARILAKLVADKVIG